MIEGGQHGAVDDQRLNRSDVVKTDDGHRIGQTHRFYRLHGSERHRVVGSHDAGNVRVGGQEVADQLKRFIGFPVGGLRGDHFQTTLSSRIGKAGRSLGGVFRTGISFQDDDLGPFTEFSGQDIANHFGSGAVVRTDKGHVDPGFGHRLWVHFHIDVDHDDARFAGLGQNRDQGP